MKAITIKVGNLDGKLPQIEWHSFVNFIAEIDLPEWDEINMRPTTKMPLCPRCKEDELGMLNKATVFCYNCGLEITKK